MICYIRYKPETVMEVDVSFKDLSKLELEDLKSIYIENRVNSMDEKSLRDYVKEVLQLQVTGTVGNEEEKEVWKEMKEFFKEEFLDIIKSVRAARKKDNPDVETEVNEYQKRIEVLENRKDNNNKNLDMW